MTTGQLPSLAVRQLSHENRALSGTVSAASSVDAEAAATVVDELASSLRELREQLNTEQGLRTYTDAPAPPSTPVGPAISLDRCNKEVRTALKTFVQRVVLCEPDAETSHHVTRVVACLDYVQKHLRQHLVLNATRTDHTGASTFDAPLRPSDAGDTVRAGTLLPPPPPASPGPLLRASSWVGLVPQPFPSSLVGRYDDDVLTVERALLTSETTLRGLHARANGGKVFRKAGSLITELALRGGSDITATDIPTVAMLCESVPNVGRLGIDTPIAPSPSDPDLAPDLRYLLIDEANRSVWTRSTTAATLEALHAKDILELHLRNSKPATVRKCLAYLSSSTSCIIVDDGRTRYVQFVDRRHAHTYTGAFVNETRFLFSKKALAGLTSLTLCATMSTDDLGELFARAFPNNLKDLRVWYGGEHRSLEHREELLRYRTSGWGRCAALQSLTLTTARPIDLISPRATPTPTVPWSIITEFLYHIHGGNIGAVEDVLLEQHGVDVVEG
ncbi:hypothetical protein AURDEDRAFT_123068 [Auricularia subglabra TFB-10046 SS5]|nr:hypothetical protein AURDEDRAFT_123068 [Auricularia subglabra TFB-10046 SS5]